MNLLTLVSQASFISTRALMLSSKESVEEVKRGARRGAVSEFERSSDKVPLGRVRDSRADSVLEGVCDSKVESDKALVGDHGMLGAKEWFLMALNSPPTPSSSWPALTMTGWRWIGGSRLSALA